MRTVGVIPSRWGSTRFPGKSLALIAGKPLVQRVYEQCCLAERLDEVLVATDDRRIADVIEAQGGRAVMTRSDHPSGTDRIAEAVASVDADIIINIQGDEPLIDPALINQLVAVFDEKDVWDMATAVTPIDVQADLQNPSVVKAVFGRNGQALYFSRAVIPCNRDGGAAELPVGVYWRHIGIYAYTRDFLLRLVQQPPCALEQLEKLEQLRALYLGGRMKVIQTVDRGLGVDTPEDAACVEQLLSACLR